MDDPTGFRYEEDSLLIEQIAQHPNYPDVLGTPVAIEAYTNGACWYLAWWLHQLTGLPVATVGGYDGEVLDTFDDPGPWDGYWWTHAGVLVDEDFLDVNGRNDVDEAMEAYLDDEGEEHGMYPLEAGDDFAEILYDPARMSEAAAAITRAVAERVLAAAGIPQLAATA